MPHAHQLRRIGPQSPRGKKELAQNMPDTFGGLRKALLAAIHRNLLSQRVQRGPLVPDGWHDNITVRSVHL